MHPDFLKIVNYASEKGLSVSVPTNGILLTKEIVDQLPRVNFAISISMDGMQANQLIRGKLSDFDFISQKLLLLKDVGVPFNVMMTLMRPNIDEAEYLLDWCRKHGIALEISQTACLGRAAANPDIVLGPEHVEQEARLYRLMEEWEDEFEGNNSYLGIFWSNLLNFGYRLAWMTQRCKGAKAIAYVTSAGQVYPCSNCAAAEIMPGGNIRQRSFTEIWEEGFDAMRRITWADFGCCERCELLLDGYFCTARCVGLSYALTGEFTNCGATPYFKECIKRHTAINQKMHGAKPGWRGLFGCGLTEAEKRIVRCRTQIWREIHGLEPVPGDDRNLRDIGHNAAPI